jgi:CubicO group peptidase (beta-lactamase class C family)
MGGEVNRSAWVAASIVLAFGAVEIDATIRDFQGKPLPAERIDREAKRLMAVAKVHGLGIAVVENGQVVLLRSWGFRNVERTCRFRPTQSCTARP